MSESKHMDSSIPDDIALKLVSSLQVWDVCSLGSCSRFWQELCGLDCVWSSLYRDRWPQLLLDNNQDSSVLDVDHNHQPHHSKTTSKGWRGLYISKHSEMAGKAAMVVKFLENCLNSESIEVETNVLLNLVGLHYCISWLRLPPEHIMEALESCKILERKVCVQWWTLGRWFYGFRMRDESHSREVSLGDVARAKEEEVLAVLYRGAIYEVFRVRISFAKPSNAHWTSQNLNTCR
ncbi:uncharacterized protein LOC141687127 isoform X2 [Apium graveolens]|uniref:uncharacterized protein LOC141687127 isoform X2 n=1 Tax=Apium graveolens TaxID=4045 RepID=UPI003D7AD353